MAREELGEWLLGEHARRRAAGLPTMTWPELNEMTHVMTALKLGAKAIQKVLSCSETFGLDGAKRGAPKDMAGWAETRLLSAVSNRRVVRAILTPSMARPLQVPGGEARAFICALNPLDGCREIAVNVSVGTIFSIHRAAAPGPVDSEGFLRCGREQVAAGYVLYGSSTVFVLSTGYALQAFTLDPILGTFFLSHRDIRQPPRGSLYSVNTGKRRLFAPSINAYLDACSKQALSLRYVGSLVADFHRNLLKGGIFLYPLKSYKHGGRVGAVAGVTPSSETANAMDPSAVDDRSGTASPQGNYMRMHSRYYGPDEAERVGLAPGAPRDETRSSHALLFHYAPLAFVAARAGGTATDGARDILDVVPETLTDTVQFLCGSRENVQDLLECMR